MLCFFFFKQKTAYELRISDWSSDVCSSDLKRSSRSAPSRNCLPPSIRGYRIISTGRAAAPRRRRTAAPRTTGKADGNSLEQCASGRLRALLHSRDRDLRRLDGERQRRREARV